MASESNTQPSSAKRTYRSSDPSPPTFQTPSSGATCNPNTPIPSCSSVQPVFQNKSLIKQLVQNLWCIESVNKDIVQLLKEKLVYKFLTGRPTDTLNHHCNNLIEELTHWVGVENSASENHNFSFRDQLLTLLVSVSKQSFKNIPLDKSEWIKLLNQWIKTYSLDDIILERDIFKILAVDGFKGMKPRDLKHYLEIILIPLRPEFEMHVRGVRAMYDFLNENVFTKSVTGTDSACMIFLTLLDFYASELKVPLLDDQVCFEVRQAKSWAEACLHKHSDYYRDLKHVDETFFKNLAKVYATQFIDETHWKNVGQECLKDLGDYFDKKNEAKSKEK